ncbi:uncharacterized protein FOMMEDRAFT_133761 [Fomitiporia mediterranea MF3/22]|uniref:uncharacterized protein n=1 Tax=Fomitiporia mediterranea (strain MF3/22) TaxID=694068 RepID=UPI0004409A61|nr:uncharacterized protein FOMMEDRAFT_133761 [Fomitiporia mediterranea MF3/22]EJD04508.1 hypothetical protein FOMMEDRAFT_133761 [Fomitiporia mediterranea MF3/22]
MYPTHIPDSLPRYIDAVIIGSGITGASVARTLFREEGSDLRALMLEARETCSSAADGRAVLPDNVELDWKDSTLPRLLFSDRACTEKYVWILLVLSEGDPKTKLFFFWQSRSRL